MKKLIMAIKICMVVLLGSVTTSCVTTALSSSFDEDFKAYAETVGYKGETGMIENANPQNSVLVYGWSIEPYVYLYYSDKNSDWETIQKVGGEFVLPPAHKGARLKIKASRYNHSSTSGAGNVIYHNSEYYEIRNDEWNVTVPKNKSIFFMGIHSIAEQNIYSWETIEEMRKRPGNVMFGFPKTKAEYDDWYKKVYTNTEKACLKKVLKKYKGTDWEPIINERISELSK